MPEYLDGLRLVPEHMHNAIIEWIEHGHNSYPPGHFLTALLCNDFMEMTRRADDVNQNALIRWAQYLYNYAPSGCFGSKAKFDAWQGVLAERDAA